MRKYPLDDSLLREARQLIGRDAEAGHALGPKDAERRCAEHRQRGNDWFFWHPVLLTRTDGHKEGRKDGEARGKKL